MNLVILKNLANPVYNYLNNYASTANKCAYGINPVPFFPV
jgi:hypothetical protein